MAKRGVWSRHSSGFLSSDFITLHSINDEDERTVVEMGGGHVDVDSCCCFRHDQSHRDTHPSKEPPPVWFHIHVGSFLQFEKEFSLRGLVTSGLMQDCGSEEIKSLVFVGHGGCIASLYVNP